ncbi:uncharacterized protein LOC129951933 [Eupeodes corollae]|uniref:uncharacterized protein LOC129951933 n=1 Tax=Eupeodes corollae TaxID=290404 RepID=UPI0024938AFC|nr:uncharacterized protein LOC129951933 [Eupeodes corollae]
MAKNGIVNSNLLDSEEINTIVNELETLPYQNVVEAVEYGRPSVYCNGTLLLYVLSIPKIDPKVHHLITVHAAIRNNKQVDLDYSRLLLSHDATYGLNEDCDNIGNTSVCNENILKKLPENSCISRLLKGGNALCNYKTTNEEIIEMIGENTVFLTNFNGSILNKNSSIPLEGTYLIQLDNEMVQIKDKTYNKICLLLTVVAIIFLLWKKIYGKANIPELRLSFRGKPIPALRPTLGTNDIKETKGCCPQCSTDDLRDADI